jgi:hypothetical protein
MSKNRALLVKVEGLYKLQRSIKSFKAGIEHDKVGRTGYELRHLNESTLNLTNCLTAIQMTIKSINNVTGKQS